MFQILGIDEPLHIKRRKVIKPGFIHSPWKSAYIRQHRIDTNWRRGELKSPKVTERSAVCNRTVNRAVGTQCALYLASRVI